MKEKEPLKCCGKEPERFITKTDPNTIGHVGLHCLTCNKVAAVPSSKRVFGDAERRFQTI